VYDNVDADANPALGEEGKSIYAKSNTDESYYKMDYDRSAIEDGFGRQRC
jgi:hypothetical protein